ncbi:1,4-beta-N-acetylmuramoylhydrolase [Listeria monocytogenes]|nr:1,4-beta-N-acetylmuramoylhydrolase [Listeria monocytogenes]EAW7155370.1 1,4-beta-N-acetylmuramoylhydrolase [Listeria monocytogenes]ECC0344236.1 1,4-beta-N-acetylmuramoylhydrolase [Listeria monocytogenes]EDH0831114.1 1,4-beta-N-acetylmuramoylhydrolase [Listeria monocytogenes]EDH0844613.1 1,4-beta-N-acetylmuramoylhydrolase [Listeria monocytogenes]
MQKTRKERILEALQEEKKNKKSKKFKTGATIAGVTAIATSITVPGIEVIVSADETAPADEASKSAEANTTTEAPATATPENTTEPTVEPKQTETKTPEENQPAAKQVEKAPAEPATVSNPDNATSSSTPATYNLLQKSALRSGATVQSFIQTIQASSSQIAAENDLYASVMIAQAILESAYGTSELGSAPNYNLFGIKGAYNGQSYTKQTLEDDGKGNYYTITAKFRKYPSYHQSLEDYAKVIRNGPSWNPNYYSKVWKSNTTSYKDATKALTGTYATDTAYATKLNDLISRYNLTQYDSGKTTGGNSGSTGNAGNSSNTGNTSNAKVYTVVKGDSLWRIANNHKVTIANLKAWNNLKSDFIYPGQKLKVSAGSTTSNTNTSKPSTGTSTSKPSTGTSTNAKVYTVVKGDSLWRIANNNKVTIANLKAWNNLKSDFIYPGQKLKVSAGSTSNTNTSKPNTNTSKPSTNTNTNAKVYTVAKGDSLWRIANNNKVTIANLKAWNNLKSDFIYPGQKLKVSAGSTTNTNTAKPSTNNPSNSTVKTYTVKKGDSLWAISRQYKTTVDNIKAWNKLTSNMIHVGQKLTIK